MKTLFKGIATALVTPFRNGEIDFKSLGKLIESQIRDGINALVVLGTTGEASTIDDEEREQIVEFAVMQVNGRIPIIVGIGGNNPRKIIEYGLQAKRAGADGVMISAPYYNKCTQDGAYKFFADITKCLQIPTIVYNVPGRTGINMEAATMVKISKLKHVVGIKEASGNIVQIMETIRDSKVPVYSGDDALSFLCYILGARGTISVASNLVPREAIEIFDLASQNKIRRARALFNSQLPLYHSLFVQPNPIPVKYYLSKKGICRNELRLPLTPMKDS
ncbi:MAG: 4-hydroxy-tetrahydrodipicolinate synthase [Firmicutes bacterium]|nr:4-hydroxy-tetrahydrodipicolinate synthase [Bacillota bacterium]